MKKTIKFFIYLIMLISTYLHALCPTEKAGSLETVNKMGGSSYTDQVIETLFKNMFKDLPILNIYKNDPVFIAGGRLGS